MKLTSLSFPTKLAICIAVPSTTLFFYLLWKQTKDSETEYESIMTRQSIIEINVPNDCVGVIIGPEGSAIKELQRLTNTRINFKKATSENSNEDFRVLVIRGSKVNAHRAELEIRKILAERPVNMVDEMFVPKYCLGRIIGRSGSSIKGIISMSGCKINVAKEPSHDVDMVKITFNGTMEQILHAKFLIEEKVKEEEEFRIKRQQQRVVPHSQSLQNFRKEQQPILNSPPQHAEAASVVATRPTTKSLPIATGKYEFSSEKPVTAVLPEVGSQCKVFVSAVQTPHMFWIQLSDEDGVKLDYLIDNMRAFYLENIDDKELFLDVNECMVGDMIAAQHKSSGWYRCEILEIKQIDSNNNDYSDDYELKVYYVDFGDSLYIKKNQARKLLKKFNELHCYGVQCSLNGVEPVNGDWEDKGLFFEEISYLCKWVELNAKIVAFKDDSNKRVSIVDLEGPDLRDQSKIVNIASVMIDNGHAIESVTMSQAF